MLDPLLPASNYRQALNETVRSSNLRPGAAAEHLIDSSKKRICQFSFDFLHERSSMKDITSFVQSYIDISGKCRQFSYF